MAAKDCVSVRCENPRSSEDQRDPVLLSGPVREEPRLIHCIYNLGSLVISTQHSVDDPDLI